jgi:hypothetical protein
VGVAFQKLWLRVSQKLAIVCTIVPTIVAFG